MQHASNIPQPKYGLGTEVLVRFDDSISHIPHISRRTVVGFLLNPDLDHLQGTGWVYLVEYREPNDSSFQGLAPEKDLSLPVPEDQVPDCLEMILTELERINASGDTWGKNSQCELLHRIDDIQADVTSILKVLRPKGSVQSSESPATSPDQN
ncbi:hypothetical protein H6F50_09135 [Coleofasciculus sp. FACHB-712]|uniref:hypothetical protein n=1 Tax=Coleofasciculus sp. FACHB-712 TaxID=2692789 RepID=UPI001688FBFA|nr:hypothetical protein [Coleofasciculus sp. FACHB-712]MBD1942517.1 hypothetical protein [Coleofasciculus sp. FACHB-712]